MKGLGALQRHQLPHPPYKNPGSATDGGTGGRAPPPVVRGRRMKKGRKINPNSPNMAISSLMQWLHETMFAIVIFKICRQLLGASPSCPTGAPLDLAG